MPAWQGEKFLNQFEDAGIPNDPSWTPDAERSAQITRIVAACAPCMYARDWPGRLNNTQHTRQERSEDKKIARRVTSRLVQAILSFGGDEALVTAYITENQASVRKRAASLEWSEWWQQHRLEISRNLRRVATHAKRNGYIKDGNRFCNTLSNEYRSLDDVLGLLNND